MESYFGYVQTVNDTLRLFEAVTRGILPSATRRLSGPECKLIRSGSVFIFDETKSGIQRWTDGLKWSSSRIDGHFLIYHQKVTNPLKSSTPHHHHHPYSNSCNHLASPSSSYHQPEHPLIKRTLSVVTSNQRKLVLISYYADSDVDNNRLKFPRQESALHHIKVPQGYYFRRITHTASHHRSAHPDHAHPHHHHQSLATATTEASCILTPLTGKEPKFPPLRLTNKIPQAAIAFHRHLPAHPEFVTSHTASSLHAQHQPLKMQQQHHSNKEQGGPQITSPASLVPPPPTRMESSRAYHYQMPYIQYNNNNNNNHNAANPGHLPNYPSVYTQPLTSSLHSSASSCTSLSSSSSLFCSTKLAIPPSPNFVSSNHHYLHHHHHHPQQIGQPLQAAIDLTNSTPPNTTTTSSSSVNRAYLHLEDQRQLSSFTFAL